MITVYADKHLYKISSFLPDEADLHLYDPQDGLPDDLGGVDALLIRTVTKIDEDTINRFPGCLSFIGTGSAGTDHVNIAKLNEHGIAFESAAGCNARSVAEYVATALILWSKGRDAPLADINVGIIGVGHVGRALHVLLEQLGISTILYDPPRMQRDPEFKSAELDEVLSAQILSFHTPLTYKGPYATHHWLDKEKLEGHTFELIINAARGGVIDEKALLHAKREGKLDEFILDVWENEPVFNDLSASHAFIKTPHIAGYSVQAKTRASEMIAEALISHFDLPQPNLIPEQNPQFIDPSSSYAAPESLSLTDVLTSIHPIENYDHELGLLMGKEPHKKALLFNKLRAEFPLRNEYSHIKVPAGILNKFPVLESMLHQ